MLRELFNPSLCKVRSYAIDEKTAQRAAKFCDYWRGLEWEKHTRLLGVTINARLSWSHYLTDVKCIFFNKLNLLKRSSFLCRNAPLDLYSKITLPSFLYGLGCFWATALVRTFYIPWKYFTVGQPE